MCVLWLQRRRAGEKDKTDSPRPPEHATRSENGTIDASPEEMNVAKQDTDLFVIQLLSQLYCSDRGKNPENAGNVGEV